MSREASDKKVLSFMGFAARARKIVSGYSTCILMMEKKKARLLILSEDLAENSLKKMTAAAGKYGTEYRIYGDMESMSHITGTAGKGIFAVTDGNFAEMISKEIDHIRSLDKEVF